MKTKQILDAVGDTTHVASEKAQEAMHQAQEYLAPIVEDALEQAQEYLAPLASQAREKGVAFAAQTKDTVQPKFEDALERVQHDFAPLLEEALDRVQHDLVPKLTAALEQAADHPLAVETGRRLSAASAALAGDLDLTQPKEVAAHVGDALAEVTGRKKPSTGATIAKVAVAGALLAAVAVAVKQFLDTRDSGWQPHQPSTPYVPQPAATVADGIAEDLESAEEVAEEVAEESAEMVAEGAPVEAAEPVETEPVAEAAADVSADGADEGPRYGDGAFVGSEPPEGFTIKGNERSMKYHVEGSGGYERTIADVWFVDEAAAEAAGFTRAQR